jgi:hypothetical protein
MTEIRSGAPVFTGAFSEEKRSVSTFAEEHLSMGEKKIQTTTRLRHNEENPRRKRKILNNKTKASSVFILVSSISFRSFCSENRANCISILRQEVFFKFS